MTPMTIAEIWDREKANLRRGFRGRQADLSPYLDLAQCEAEARRGVERLQKAARGEKRAAFDKARKNRPSGRRLNNRLTGGMIVGVDCEGMNVGGHFILAYARDGTGSKIANAISAEDKPKFIEGGEAVYRRQRPCMFMMGGVEDQGYRDQILESSEGLKTYQICEWFLKTAREFASKDPKGKQPVFVGYGCNLRRRANRRRLVQEKTDRHQQGQAREPPRRPDMPPQPQPMGAVRRLRDRRAQGQVD